MANEGRFLNKKFLRSGGVVDDDGSSLLNNGGGWELNDGSSPIKGVIQTSAVWSLPAVPGIVGSVNAVVSTDIPLTNVAVGDVVFAAPITSLALGVQWRAACYSAGAVNIRANYTGTTGAYTGGAVTWRVVALKF